MMSFPSFFWVLLGLTRSMIEVWFFAPANAPIVVAA